MLNFTVKKLRVHGKFMSLSKAQRLSTIGQFNTFQEYEAAIYLERQGIVTIDWPDHGCEPIVNLVHDYSDNVDSLVSSYWVLQLVGSGTFVMATVNEGSDPLEGRYEYGYEVVSGPYLWISPAQKALALALESNHEGSCDAWDSARLQLIGAVRGTIPANGVVPDWYALLEELELLIRDWDTS